MFAPPLLAHAALLAQLAVPAVTAPPAGYPFDVGETLHYDVRLGFVPIGSATASVVRLTQERGTEAFVFTATGEGGPPGAHLRYELTSWVAKARFHSLRFYRRIVQRKSDQEDRYQIVPDSLRYRREGTHLDWATPPHPLDELAFLYYLRTMPLQVGRSYTVARYFRTAYNPVTVRVAGRPIMKLADGRAVPCFALVLTSHETTLNLWLTDDARRLPVQLEIPFWFGNARLKLAE